MRPESVRSGSRDLVEISESMMGDLRFHYIGTSGKNRTNSSSHSSLLHGNGILREKKRMKTCKLCFHRSVRSRGMRVFMVAALPAPDEKREFPSRLPQRGGAVRIVHARA